MTILDDDDPPVTVNFSSSSYTVSEDGTTATITVNLSAAVGSTVTVGY